MRFHEADCGGAAGGRPHADARAGGGVADGTEIFFVLSGRVKSCTAQAQVPTGSRRFCCSGGSVPGASLAQPGTCHRAGTVRTRPRRHLFGRAAATADGLPSTARLSIPRIGSCRNEGLPPLPRQRRQAAALQSGSHKNIPPAQWQCTGVTGVSVRALHHKKLDHWMDLQEGNKASARYFAK